MGVTILKKDRAYPITKNHAFCLLVFLPVRLVQLPGSIIVREVGAHWERVTSHGRVVRCHTELEAQEACGVLMEGISQGQWLKVAYTPYDPTSKDLPYHDWIRGETQRVKRRLGISPGATPEEQDPGLERLSDEEWITKGPR